MGVTDPRARIAAMVSEATGGDVSAVDVLDGGSLTALGVDSLGLLRLVDALELEYGVEVELTAPGQRVDTVDDLVAIVAQG
ncbi:acyl carrier protein [Micromonospora carbonacea]|uniref:acyl carrier protein n=1 Tax=Micromonospora carbonacea TaxID=47853 RepID=UPI003D705CE5